MKREYSYRKILSAYKKFQFHVSGFILGVGGIWIAWKISKRAYLPDWLVWLVVIWSVAIAVELARFIYIFKRPTGNKENDR